MNGLPDPAAEREELEKLFGADGEIVMPSDAQSPILTKPVRAALHQWLFEMNAEDELRAVGLKPRNRCMLSGPPGCGKTTLAHHISARLGIPMLVVQSHEIGSKYINETGENIGKLFRRARRGQHSVALFFDEFDSLAKSRENLSGANGDNERANITIALLQEFDRYDGLLFAATNVTSSIDPAIWRRFQMQIEIGFPGAEERFAIVRMYLAPYQVPDETVEGLAKSFEGAAPALIREGCESIKRSLLLGPRMNLPTDLPAILQRFAASAAPADGQPVPKLWSNQCSVIADAVRLPWPPSIPERQA